MRTLIATFAVLVAVIIALPAEGQQKRASAHETVSAVIAGNRVTITYGRPNAKDRKIWGGLVPYGKAWRTGADEATTILTQQPIVIGDTTIPAGAYTLYTVPAETGTSKLAFSKKLGQWGIPVDEKNDLVRVDMKKDTVDKKVDQFTIAVEKADKGGVIKMTWDNTQYSVAFANGKK